MKTINNKLNTKHYSMREEALNHLKMLVNNKFKQNKNLNCFVLVMGTYFWTDLNNEVLYEHEVNYKSVKSFLNEWDNILNLTGEGVKWFRDGSVVTDW